MGHLPKQFNQVLIDNISYGVIDYNANLVDTATTWVEYRRMIKETTKYHKENPKSQAVVLQFDREGNAISNIMEFNTYGN